MSTTILIISCLAVVYWAIKSYRQICSDHMLSVDNLNRVYEVIFFNIKNSPPSSSWAEAANDELHKILELPAYRNGIQDGVLWPLKKPTIEIPQALIEQYRVSNAN